MAAYLIDPVSLCKKLREYFPEPSSFPEDCSKAWECYQKEKDHDVQIAEKSLLMIAYVCKKELEAKKLSLPPN